MRRVLVVALLVSSGIVLSGCPRSPKPGECKTSDDCAGQEGVGRVCVEGRCQQCGQDSDCKAGFVCRDNACVPQPQCGPDRPCPAGQECQNDRCVASADDQASRDRDAAAAGAVPAECADPSAFTIRFEFDQASVSGDAQQKLQQLADCLRKAPAKSVTANGHADERGTSQYNVALSGRRAEAAKKYLSDLGASATVRTVPNGEENPLCTESTEACWAQNRRVEFQFER